MRSFALIGGMAASLTLCGCAAVNSTMAPVTSSGGLLYYMPMRDIQIAVTNTGGKITSIIATASTSYADRTKSYQLEYQPHMLAKNTMDLEISEAGLITSSKANQTGDAVAALGSLGTLAGYWRGNGLGVQSAGGDVVLPSNAPSLCKLDGTHTFLLPAEPVETEVCGSINVKVERLAWTPQTRRDPISALQDGASYAGVFYRMNLPYRVTMKSEGLNAQTIVHSPSESPAYFLPVARTLFANNDAQITLSNGAGVPSKYIQNTDGELAALLKLPAAIIAPYFSAIGQIFQFRSTGRTQESADMAGSINLDLAKIKYQKCLDAIEAKDAELINNLRCNN
jgi:hypothetical protein